jgi:hypothetical protein
MARVPVYVFLGLGMALVGGTSIAADVPDTPSASTAAPDNTVIYDDFFPNGEKLVGATKASKKLQWVDDAEAKLPAKADLPDVDSSAWLPTN